MLFFIQIGTFDPYSDDPRLAIKKVWLCPQTGTLIAAGTAGHVIVLQLSDSARDAAVPVSISILSTMINIKI